MGLYGVGYDNSHTPKVRTSAQKSGSLCAWHEDTSWYGLELLAFAFWLLTVDC